MSIVASIRKQITPIHPEGFLFVAGAVVLALVADWLLPRVGWLFWLLADLRRLFLPRPEAHDALCAKGSSSRRRWPRELRGAGRAAAGTWPR